MISPELLRRYPFSAGLDHERIVDLAKIGNEVDVEAGTYFFHDGDQVDKFYLVVKGAVAVLFEIPDRGEDPSVSDQLTGELPTKEVVISTIGTGNTFGWASIIPPHESFASAKATTHSKILVFDAAELQKMFAADPEFAYQMTLRAAQIMREQLRDLSIETLAFIA